MSIGTQAIKGATAIKLVVVVFMMVVGFTLFDSKYLSPFIPTEHEFEPNGDDEDSGLTSKTSFGLNGVIAGATQAFFGFVGFDEVCCMAAQTKDASRVMPKAVLGTIAGVTVLSAGASLALVSMVSYEDISASGML